MSGRISDARSHYLYRVFDTDGDLLYIGRTAEPRKRLMSHQTQTPWWPQADSVTLQMVARTEVAAAEKRAILAERPRFNRDPAESARTAAARRTERDRLHAAGLRCDLPIARCAGCTHFLTFDEEGEVA